MSSVNKDNSNTTVKTLGQVLPYCISGENASVKGCKCHITQEQKGERKFLKIKLKNTKQNHTNKQTKNNTEHPK